MKAELKCVAWVEEAKEEKLGMEWIKLIKSKTFRLRDQSHYIGSIQKTYQKIVTLFQAQEHDAKAYSEKIRRLVEVLANYGANIIEDESLYSEDEVYKNLTAVEQEDNTNIDVTKFTSIEAF